MSCVLCNVIENENYRHIFADQHVVVVLNNEPVKEGHLIILPRRHAEDLGDLEPNEAQSFLKGLQRCMELSETFSPEAPMCLVNGWKYRTQPHLHAHVLPSKVGMRGLYSAAEGVNGRRKATDDELHATAERLRALLSTQI